MTAARLWKTRIAISAAVLVAVLFVALVLIKPAMPDRIDLLTGPVGSAYHQLGERYAEDLRRHGLDVNVIATDGTLDNLRRLGRGGPAVALAPATVGRESDIDGVDLSQLVALASVDFEPLWLFYRAGLDIERFADLAGRSVATAGAGTNSDAVARMLLDVNGIAGDVEVRSVAGQTVEALLDRLTSEAIDAIFVTGNAHAPTVRTLLDADGVSFLSFERAETYAALLAGVTTLVAPEGVFDLARNVPPEEAHLLATTTCLVAHERIHPAVVPLLLEAAENARRQKTTFSTTITFPSREHVTLPLDAAARRYFDQGTTGLSRFLPYKVTRFLNHLGFLVLPLLTAAVLLLKIVPLGLRVSGNLRLKRLFKQLAAVEKGHASGADRATLLADLDRIDRASAKMFVPLSVVHDYIDFRQFLHDMRERVQ
ncbi:MAG: ABC transporter substrate-binding protein [Planctomycetes bacterium]|nr:ABC transporter substrate-binding protein [Planctomycetota bacterium]